MTIKVIFNHKLSSFFLFVFFPGTFGTQADLRSVIFIGRFYIYYKVLDLQRANHFVQAARHVTLIGDR
jgi:hypothetical protein